MVTEDVQDTIMGPRFGDKHQEGEARLFKHEINIVRMYFSEETTVY